MSGKYSTLASKRIFGSFDVDAQDEFSCPESCVSRIPRSRVPFDVPAADAAYAATWGHCWYPFAYKDQKYPSTTPDSDEHISLERRSCCCHSHHLSLVAGRAARSPQSRVALPRKSMTFQSAYRTALYKEVPCQRFSL